MLFSTQQWYEKTALTNEVTLQQVLTMDSISTGAIQLFNRKRKFIGFFGERIGVISAVTASLTFLFTLVAFYIEAVTAETTLGEFCGFILLAGIPSYIVLLAGSSQNRYGNFSEVAISAKLIAPLILFVAFFGLLAIIFASIGW